MGAAVKTLGQVLKNGTATLMARIRGDDAEEIVRADISAIAYTVYLLDDNDPNTRTEIENHEAVAVTVNSVVYDTLQTDDRWTVDATGYNFRHTIPIATYAAFETAGKHFLVEYVLTPVSGQKILVVYDLECL